MSNLLTSTICVLKMRSSINNGNESISKLVFFPTGLTSKESLYNTSGSGWSTKPEVSNVKNKLRTAKSYFKNQNFPHDSYLDFSKSLSSLPPIRSRQSFNCQPLHVACPTKRRHPLLWMDYIEKFVLSLSSNQNSVFSHHVNCLENNTMALKQMTF